MIDPAQGKKIRQCSVLTNVKECIKLIIMNLKHKRKAFEGIHFVIQNDGRCVYCGQRSNELDHFVPYSVSTALADVVIVKGKYLQWVLRRVRWRLSDNPAYAKIVGIRFYSKDLGRRFVRKSADNFSTEMNIKSPLRIIDQKEAEASAHWKI